MNTITPDMIDAIKVQFIKSIFEEDFPETGMKAWLTKIEWSDRFECYRLYFDFTEFESENEKYLTETYYPNRHTKEIQEKTGRCMFTAKESGWYTNKYDVYFSFGDHSTRDDEAFKKEILNYLRVI
ncbi:MAG TPA: hypothetical protein VFM18_08435 [Methanosarcina sp.]|nr:hypothetical protein [Methanosarcina sp.]